MQSIDNFEKYSKLVLFELFFLAFRTFNIFFRILIDDEIHLYAMSIINLLYLAKLRDLIYEKYTIINFKKHAITHITFKKRLI